VRDITEACKKHEIAYRLVPTLSDLLSQEHPHLVHSAALPQEGRV
jgi:hypothetical protein